MFFDTFYVSGGIAFAESEMSITTVLIVHNQKEFCKCLSTVAPSPIY